jgi:hypothetical protein
VVPDRAPVDDPQLTRTGQVSERGVLAFFLLLMIVAIVLGLAGVVLKGLLFLLFIGIVVFLVPFS